jgi:hypothetical protein
MERRLAERIERSLRRVPVRQAFAQSASSVHITESSKTKNDFIRASGWTPDNDIRFDRWITVGNGESDIMPALTISPRWSGVCVPHGSRSKFFDNKEHAKDFMPPPFLHQRVVSLNNLL